MVNLLAKAIALGINYKTGDLLGDIDANFAEVPAQQRYSFQFTDASLDVDSSLTVTHNLNTEFIIPIILRPDNTYEIAWGYLEYISDNQSKLNFGGSIASGTWKALFVTI